MRRHGLHVHGGLRDLNSYITGGDFSIQYTDYRHDEIDSIENEIETRFNNKLFAYRAVIDQKRSGAIFREYRRCRIPS